MTYMECVKQCCEEYNAKYPLARFIGYNTVYGSRMYGTLAAIPAERCIEAPVAENLMMGLAMGMSLEGYRPVVCFERHDFLLLALDALVNHVDKLPVMGDIRFPIIVRAIVGGKFPLNAGEQHTQDHTAAMRHMLKNTPVIEPTTRSEFKWAWGYQEESPTGCVVIVEKKDLYQQEIPGQ